MNPLKFKLRETFTANLKRLATIDKIIVSEVREAIEILLEGDSLPDDFQDHPLTRKMSGYREFHLRDTPKGNVPNESTDVLVVYRIDEVELVLIGIRVGSQDRLFPGQNRANTYRKNEGLNEN